MSTLVKLQTFPELRELETWLNNKGIGKIFCKLIFLGQEFNLVPLSSNIYMGIKVFSVFIYTTTVSNTQSFPSSSTVTQGGPQVQEV